MKKSPIEKIVLFFLGAMLIIYSFTIKGAEGWGVSPALFCMVCGGAISVLALILKTQGSEQQKDEQQKDEQQADEQQKDEQPLNTQLTINIKNNTIKQYIKPILFIITVILYSFFIGKVHFVVATTIFVFLLTTIMDKKAYLENFIWSISSAFVVYFIFEVLFGVML